MMRLEKTTTGLIIHEPDMEIKEKCLEYFSLQDPVREYFVYSGTDPTVKTRFGKDKDVLYIPSGFLKIQDPVIRKLHGIRPIASQTPRHVEITMTREPRSDLQRDCIKILTTSTSPKITVELKPGTGKTFIAMYSIWKLKMKALIVAPTTLLKNQWIENIEDSGISRDDVATSIYDATNKTFCVVTISSIENALRDDWYGLWDAIDKAGFGIKIIDEAHLHLKGMLRFDALCNIQHNWYLSATLGRSADDEDRILNLALLDAERFVGSDKYEEYQKAYIRIYMQNIKYNIPRQVCDEYFKFGKKGLIRATYYRALLNYKNGVPFMQNIITMVKKAKAISKSDKKILVLLPLIEIIERVQRLLRNESYFKGLNIVGVDGSLSIAEKRARLENGDIILSTTQSMGTGVDVQNLIAVVNFDQLASPITSEQIVGRLRDRGYDTFYFDICDIVKYAKTIENWGNRRRALYPYFPGVYKEMYKLPTIYC